MSRCITAWVYDANNHEYAACAQYTPPQADTAPMVEGLVLLRGEVRIPSEAWGALGFTTNRLRAALLEAGHIDDIRRGHSVAAALGVPAWECACPRRAASAAECAAQRLEACPCECHAPSELELHAEVD